MPLANSEAIVAAALITAPATNTIVFVHRRQLMDHWLARLATFLDLPASGIGRIGGGWIRRPSSRIDLRSACEIAVDRDGPDLAFRRESRFPGAGTRLPARADGQQLPPPSNKERIARFRGVATKRPDRCLPCLGCREANLLPAPAGTAGSAAQACRPDRWSSPGSSRPPPRSRHSRLDVGCRDEFLVKPGPGVWQISGRDELCQTAQAGTSRFQPGTDSRRPEPALRLVGEIAGSRDGSDLTEITCPRAV